MRWVQSAGKGAKISFEAESKGVMARANEPREYERERILWLRAGWAIHIC